MTNPSADAMLLEMLAGCERLAEGYARSLRAVQQLTTAALEGRSLSTTALEAYDAQAERTSADLDRFRALIAEFKTRIRVH